MDKQQTYLRYIRHLSETKDSYNYVGRAAVIVGKFLDGVSNIGKREKMLKLMSKMLTRANSKKVERP